MNQPGDGRISDGADTADLPAAAPRPSKRHRRWPLVLAVLMGLVLISNIVDAIVDSSQTGVAVAGTLTGVALGLIGLRYLPPIDDTHIGFGLVRAEGSRDEEPERGGVAWRVLSGLALVAGGAAAYFLLSPLIEPFPTTFFNGALVVLIPATLIQWCYPAVLFGRRPTRTQRHERRTSDTRTP